MTNKCGRPRIAEGAKRQQIGVRTSPLLKERLEIAALANGRSVAAEAEARLDRSFYGDDVITRLAAIEQQLFYGAPRQSVYAGRVVWPSPYPAASMKGSK